MSAKEKLISWLFETNAVRVSPEDKPFWYTSGTIGPYYINTHFLYGSEQKANELLKVIDNARTDKLACSGTILNITRDNYETDPIYRGCINQMVDYIKDNLDVNDIDYISGGERRDWYFSLIIAEILKKPHITIFKDLSTVLFNNGAAEFISNINGKRVLHIADIITEAASYTRAWIPAVRGINGILAWSLVVIDRLQGGADNLRIEGVKSNALMEVNIQMFDMALSLGYINEDQYKMLKAYIDNPKGSMRSFLKEYPEFLENALNGDERTKERVKLCMDKNIYEL